MEPHTHFVDIFGMNDAGKTYPEIGQRLEAIRNAFAPRLGVKSQREWATRHGWIPTRYGNWETGHGRIPVEEAEKLCGLYGLTLDFIYRGRRDGLSETASKSL